MKSYWMDVINGQADIQLRDCAIPEPGADQVLVRTKASSLNRGEFLLQHGLHKGGSAKPIGIEAAGVVERCGPGVTSLKPGDAVFGRCQGGFSEYVLMSTAEAMPKPDNMSWEEAAATAIATTTSHDCLVIQGHLKAGEWVLITGVTSGVGVCSLSMAKALGAKVIGTSGSQAKLDRLKDLGLDVGICLRGPGFYEQIMEVTNNKGVDLVVNTVGGSVFEECIRSMGFQGRLATVGYVDDVVESKIDLKTLHARRLTVFGVSNKQRTAAQKAEFLPQYREQILPLLAQRKIVSVVDRSFPFEQLTDAIAMMEAGQHLGKIVLLAPSNT